VKVKEDTIMLTKFGKFLRVLRMERGELLKNMAENLRISSAYLSSIEMGNREIPKSLPQDLIQKYNLTEEEQVEMQKAISASIKNIDISLVNTTNLQKEAALVFARNLEKMNDTSIEEFLDFMKKREGK
jgi:transcriptional regulator with XRE-family HTH domain